MYLLSAEPAFGWETAKCYHSHNSVPKTEEGYIESSRLECLKEGREFTDFTRESATYRFQDFQEFEASTRRDRNIFHTLGCVPLIGIVIGIMRIWAHTIGAGKFPSSNRNNHIFRGVLEIAQLGLLLLLVDAVVTLYRNAVADKMNSSTYNQSALKV